MTEWESEFFPNTEPEYPNVLRPDGRITTHPPGRKGVGKTQTLGFGRLGRNYEP